MANTGYRINTYIDVNPKSPTFNTTREERVRDDSSCGVASASWEVVSSYCELDDLGANTGFYITSEMDTNVSSPTYGTTRENRSQNLSECPLPSKEPSWAFDMDDAECEEKLFPKSGLYGQTGRLHAIVTDENIYSDTFGQTEERYLTISDWTSDMKSAYGEFPCKAVDTNPQIEAISEACETVADEYGTLVFNGFKNVTGLDKNPYSDTYLDSVTQRVQDTVKCPPAEDAKFYYRDGSQDNLTTRNISVGWEKSNYTIYVTSSRGSGVLPYSVSIPSSYWMSYDKPNDTTLTFTIEKNMNTTERSQTVTLTQDRTSKECTIRFTQETPPYYFYIGSNSSTTSQTISVSNSSTSETLTITSLFGDEYKDYDVSGVPNWVTVTRMSANKTITFKIDANTSTTSRSATVTLTQQTSGKRCVITLSQGGATPTTYTFGISKTSGGSTASTLTYNMSSAIGTQTVYVTSSSSVNSSLGWGATITKGSSWIKIPTEQQGLLVFTIDGNTDTDDREGTITLTQNESGRQCTISITQEGIQEAEDENTPQYVEKHGVKFSYGATGNYEFSQLWVDCETYSIEEGFYNAGSETQNSGDVYVLEKFVDKHEYIEFKVYGRDSGMDKLYFYFGDFNFSYTSDDDFNVRTGQATQVNGKKVMVRVTRLKEENPYSQGMRFIENAYAGRYTEEGIIEDEEWQSPRFARNQGGCSCTWGNVPMIMVPSDYKGTYQDFKVKVDDPYNMFGGDDPYICNQAVNGSVSGNSTVFGSTSYPFKGYRLYAFWISNPFAMTRDATVEVTNDYFPGKKLVYKFTQTTLNWQT